MDQTRIVGLIIDPNVLASIRRNRLSVMGVARAQAIDYAEIKVGRGIGHCGESGGQGDRGIGKGMTVAVMARRSSGS